MKKGFTLIELLIVISVIAILISIILPSFKGMQEEGEIIAAKGEVATLKTGAESYYLHHDRTYPTSLSDLTTARPLIVSAIPKDRFNKDEYYNYEKLEGGYYIIWSNGPNETQEFTIDYGERKIKIPKNSDDIIETNAYKVEE